jgi:cytochrome oxidase assembly protein ShyY1
LKQDTFRRWGPWLALVIVFALATSALSWWQFTRRAERVARIDQIVSNYDAAPIPYEEITWRTNKDGSSPLEWLPVAVSGSYLPESSFLVRNRPLSGQPGFMQLVPLRLDDGRLLIVERGWLPAASDISVPLSNPLPDPGYSFLVVRLRIGEPDVSRGEAETLASVNLDEIARRLAGTGEVITQHYGRLASESPTYPETPFPMPKPSLSEGNHLSYAVQWIIFGVMAFIAFFWAYRNDRRLALEAQGLLEPKTKKPSQADLDAEFEDS